MHLLKKNYISNLIKLIVSLIVCQIIVYPCVFYYSCSRIIIVLLTHADAFIGYVSKVSNTISRLWCQNLHTYNVGHTAEKY